MNPNHQNHSVSSESLARHHESRDPSLRPAMQVGVLVALSIGACIAVVGFLFGVLSQKRMSSASPPQPAKLVDSSQRPLDRFPGPALQVNEGQDLQDWRRRETQKLNSYGWVDRPSGIIHVPISRAMDMILERGLPVRSTNAPPTGVSSLDLIRNRSQTR
jgi:hypothetical protein